MDKLKNYILTINDDLLIKLSSKGLLKRAYKDYEKKGLVPEIIEGPGEVSWEYPSGEAVCSLSLPDLAKATCSCPSSSICRHILTGIIHLKKMWSETEKEDEPPPSSKAWHKLYSATDSDLKKWADKKKLDRALQALREGVNIEIKKGKTLEAIFPDLSVQCSFLPFAEPGSGICTCKKSDCDHELMAILKIQLQEGKRKLSKKEEPLLSSEGRALLKKVQNVLKELLITGIDRASLQTLNHIEALALEAHNSDMPRIEKELRGIRHELNLHISGNAAFNRYNYMDRAGRIYGITKILENFDGSFPLTDLTGVHKSRYIEVGNIKVAGAGAGAWKTGSGYSGITCYFLNEDKNNWFTFTLTRPEFYEGNSFDCKSAYYNDFPWDSSISIHSLSRRYLSLISASRNMEGRLSGSKNTGVTLMDFVCPKDLLSSSLCISQWKDLPHKAGTINRDIYREKRENASLFFLKIEKWDKPVFDEVNQVLGQVIYDKEEKKISLKIYFNDTGKRAIENIELIYDKNIQPLLILGHIYIEEGSIYVLPITFYFDFFLPGRGYSLNLNLDEFKGPGDYS